jgi:hypothetical protein
MANPPGGNLLQMPCMLCTGVGTTTCAGCGGSGGTYLSKSRLRYDRSIEYYQERQMCRVCSGTGRILCLSCKGAGWTLQHQPASGQSSRPPKRAARAAPTPRQPSTPFAFTPFQHACHPDDDEIWAFWQDDPGNCLDYMSHGQGGRLFLSECLRDTWLYIEHSGSRFPLEIYIPSFFGLTGRWL